VDNGEDGFAKFYEDSYLRVVGLVAGLTGDRAQAEDITQEAFARALVRWRKVGLYDQPEAWVRQVACRLVIDASRRSRRALSASSLLVAALRGRAVAPDPLGQTELALALLRMPVEQRQVIVMHYLADLPVEEIARDCGVSVTTIRTRLAAARRRLARELTEAPWPPISPESSSSRQGAGDA
jgi:RNA polymerase sigma-70 factor, ECF subfamily